MVVNNFVISFMNVKISILFTNLQGCQKTWNLRNFENKNW